MKMRTFILRGWVQSLSGIVNRIEAQSDILTSAELNSLSRVKEILNLMVRNYPTNTLSIIKKINEEPKTKK